MPPTVKPTAAEEEAAEKLRAEREAIRNGQVPVPDDAERMKSSGAKIGIGEQGNGMQDATAPAHTIREAEPAAEVQSP